MHGVATWIVHAATRWATRARETTAGQRAGWDFTALQETWGADFWAESGECWAPVGASGNNLSPNTNWLALCGQNAQPFKFYVNGKSKGTSRGGTGNGHLRVNWGGCCNGETSHWAVAEVRTSRLRSRLSLFVTPFTPDLRGGRRVKCTSCQLLDDAENWGFTRVRSLTPDLASCLCLCLEELASEVPR